MSGDPLRIGVCGVGTVGLATIEILRQQSDLISVLSLIHISEPTRPY